MKIPIIMSLLAAFAVAMPLAPTADAAPKKPKSSKSSKAKSDIPYENAVEVFVAGEGNPYKSIRIPDVIKAGNSLIAVAEGRYTNSDQGQNDLIVSVSKDGKKWSKPVVAAASKGATFNNPCLIYDKEAKQIVLFFQRYPAGVKERDKDIPTGHEGEKCIRNFVCFSKNGKSWTTPKDVTKDTKSPTATITCSGPNPGVQLTRGEHKGRLCVPLNEGPFGDWKLACAYSDDHGKTWKIGKQSAPGGGVNEVSMAETDEGGLIIVSRSLGGSNNRKLAYSEDGGETWGPISEHSDLPSVGFGCQNGLTRYSHADDESKGGRSRIIYSSPSGGSRENGVIKMSYDDGKTWPVSKPIGDGPFAYSVLTPVKPGVVGIIFEKNANPITHIMFTTFTLDWLTDGEDDGKKAADGAANEAPSVD